MATTTSESARVHDLFSSLEAKVQAAENGQRAAEEERDAAVAAAKAVKDGIAAMPSDVFELRKVALLTGAEQGKITTFASGWGRAWVDRRHLCAAVAVDQIPGDSGQLIASLNKELIYELTLTGSSRPLYAAMAPETEFQAFKIFWGAAPKETKKP